MNTNNPVQNTPTIQQHPNDSETLKDVLGALAYMMEHDQIAKNAPALVNILSAVEGYDSDDMATFRQTLLGQFTHEEGTVLTPAECETYELWEEEYKDDLGKPLGFKPPFADFWNSNTPAAAEQSVTESTENYNDIVLTDSQVSFICEALDVWVAEKRETMSEGEATKLDSIIEALA